ncbi:MAG: sigma-70 family RNA polymerase sigma factor [Eubacteriales bacterium]
MNDNDLIELLINRSGQAVEKTQQEYGKYLYNIAFRVLKNREDAEECVNDTLLKVWETIPPQIPKSLKAYVGTVARNISLDTYRKQNSIKRNSEFTELLEESAQCQELNPEKQVELKEVAQCISDYLRNLPEEKRLLFIARYYHGYPLSEIAKARNLTQGKVKMTLMRMRKELKKHLESEGVWQ